MYAIRSYYALGLDWRAATIAGLGLALSSTALVLQSLAERGQLATRHGRAAFAVLLFQDLAVIPLLALLPLLAGEGGDLRLVPALKGLAAIMVVRITSYNVCYTKLLRASRTRFVPEGVTPPRFPTNYLTDRAIEPLPSGDRRPIHPLERCCAHAVPQLCRPLV